SHARTLRGRRIERKLGRPPMRSPASSTSRSCWGSGTLRRRPVYRVQASRRVEMKRAAIAALLAASFLVVTTAAEAKEPPAGFQLCGSNGCETIGMNDGEPLAISLFFGGGSVEVWTPIATPAPFYSLRWSYQQGQVHTAYFVPDLNMIRFVGDSASATVDPRPPIHWPRL